MSAKLIQVIECEEREGAGVPTDPHRIVVRYYSTEGKLLAERDEWRDSHPEVWAGQQINEFMERIK